MVWVVIGWCLGGVLMIRWCLGGVLTMIRWCLGSVWVGQGKYGMTDLAVAGAVPTWVVEQGPAKPLPQQLPILPQLLWALARPPATPLQVELQLALPVGG